MLPVHSIRVSNPFFEGANTVYVIESDPLTLIDTGIATHVAYERLLSGLAAHGMSVRDIGRVILTHKHIDHIGNAWRIQQTTGAEIFIHECEVRAVTEVDAQSERFATLVNRRFDAWHVPGGSRVQSDSIPRWELESAQATGLHDGQEIDLGGETIRVIHTPGHTMGSICLLQKDRLFSGDHVLQEISPNVGAGDVRQQGLLRVFLKSLERIRDIADSPQVMPGHGTPFDNLTARCEELIKHHRERLDEITRILASNEMSVFEVACELFGQLDNFHTFLGCAEANSHLEYLAEDQRVVESHGRFRLAGHTT